jgi:PAS domain S-box-containing protein
MIYELQQGLVERSDLPGSDGELAELGSYLKRKYADKKLDLILSMAAPRVRILLEKDPRLFGDVPKVFYEFDSEREATNHSLGPNITGVWANLDFYKTLDLALALHPDTRKVVVISGNGPEDNLNRERAQAEFRKYESRAKFSYLIGDTIKELKSELAALDKNSVVIFLMFTRDKEGNRYSSPEALAMIAPASRAPIYGYSDTLMGLGITGGNLLDFEGIGKRLGTISLHVLAGERPEQIPQETAPTVITVDWRELQRWGISEQRLPPGSIVRFKEPSLWEVYKRYAIGLVAAVIVEALLIAWLLFLGARRRQAEEENLRLATRSEAEHRRLGEIVSNVPGMVWETLIDPTTNVRKSTFVSSYVEKMFGYTQEEWLAEPPGFGFRLMPDPGDRENVAQYSEAVIASGKDGVTRFRSATKDGHLIWVETYLSPILSDNQTVVGLRGVSLDVTDRVLAEESVRQTQERSQAILRAIPDLILLQSPDGTFLDCHAQNPKDLLVPADELIGKNMRDVLPPELAEQFRKIFEQTSEELQIVEYKLTLDHVDRWFESRIVRSGENILSVVRDITERKLAAAAIKESELNYRSIFNAANDAILVHDLETGAVLDVNERMCEMYECTVEEARQTTAGALSFNEPPYTREEAMMRIQKAGSGQPQVFEWRARKKSGQLFWVEVALRHILLGSKDCLLAVVRDITERKTAMDELRQSEERFAKAFRANPQPMSITAISDGRYIDVNDSFLAISGYTRDEVIGHTSLELQVWETPESRKDFLRQLTERGSTVNIETRFRTRSGAMRILLSSAESLVIGGVRCLLRASSDITERVRTEAALRKRKEQLSEAQRLAKVGSWEWDPATDTVTWSEQMYRIMGRDPSLPAVSYKDHPALYTPPSWARLRAAVDQALKLGTPYELELELIRSDGQILWTNARGEALKNGAGRVVKLQGTLQDITERKQAEADLQRAMMEVSRLKNQLQEENIYLQEEIKLEQNFDEIVGDSDALKYVLFKIEQVAPTDSTVLITGETGTGKELVARAIHSASSRRERPLVKVNCAALSPSLIESELFGHEKGAFTGASSRKIGRFELANGATIFLDEIGELPPELQVKLLRIIQEGEFERLGSSRTINVDVRIIAATNRKLDLEVKEGTFREDLWYRLNVFPITVPPLRQRQEDIPLLVEHFAGRFAKKFGKTITSISPATLKSLRDYSWPGNVRELANVIERAAINSHGPVLQVGKDFETAPAKTLTSATMTLEDMEREYIIRILEDRGWRIEGRRGAARLLGLNPSTLRTRMMKLGIHKPESLSKSAS